MFSDCLGVQWPHGDKNGVAVSKDACLESRFSIGFLKKIEMQNIHCHLISNSQSVLYSRKPRAAPFNFVSCHVFSYEANRWKAVVEIFRTSRS